MLEKHSLWWIKLEMLPILSTSDVQQGIQLLWELSSELKVQPRKCQNPDPAYSFHYITPLCFTFVGSKSHFSHVCMLSHFSHVWLCATPWTVTHQAPLPMGFSRQEYWSVLPCPLPGDLPSPGIEPRSPGLPSGPPRKSSVIFKLLVISLKMLLFLFFLDLINILREMLICLIMIIYCFFSLLFLLIFALCLLFLC